MKLKKKNCFLPFVLTAGTIWGIWKSISHQPTQKHHRPCIGIIAALSFEVEIIKDQIQHCRVENIGGSDFYSGQIGNYDIILTQCGMGKVSAAGGAQAMITRYHPDYVINTGCAGALSKDLNVGDFVIADQTVEWDLDLQAIGFPRGFVSAMNQVKMKTDIDLTDKIYAVITNKATAIRGTIVSGDQFVSTPEQRKIILDAFPSAMCAEMEGAAIGHICAQNNVPFSVIRCMSDNANSDSGVDFAEFSEIAGQKSAEILLKFLHFSL